MDSAVHRLSWEAASAGAWCAARLGVRREPGRARCGGLDAESGAQRGALSVRDRAGAARAVDGGRRPRDAAGSSARSLVARRRVVAASPAAWAGLALFGSVLRGQPDAQSDVDVLVQFAAGAKSYERFLALAELLEAHLGRPVDLVTPEALTEFIGPRILAEAQDILRAA